MAMKRCSRCKKTKHLTDFGISRKCKDGRLSACKACLDRWYKKSGRVYAKAYYVANRDRLLAYGAAYRAANPDKMSAYRARYKTRYSASRTKRLAADLRAAGYTVTPPTEKGQSDGE